MTYLAKYKKSDFKRLSWNEQGKTFEILYKKVIRYIKKKKAKIDAVIPILRGGAFPGTYLAYRLNLLRILPVQYKYFFENEKIKLKKILGIPKKDLPKKPTFLLVENNHCFGLTASTAAKDLKKSFPKCRIIYAADHIDYSYQNAVNAEAVFYGRLTNETKKLSSKECEKKSIRNVCYLFPWERLEEEWSMVTAKQFEYEDLDRAQIISKLKLIFKNE